MLRRFLTFTFYILKQTIGLGFVLAGFFCFLYL